MNIYEGAIIQLQVNGRTKTNPIKLQMDILSIEIVKYYAYLDHVINLGKTNQDTELKRRTQLTKTAFSVIHFKRKVCDTCIVPVYTYKLETKSLH